ncbi:PA0069 family radical SAM protein [Roseospira marina]|uniref:PA0069 family radical SAM protein n=1 Tax=Roseospira marina TaxID=140057 RepID=A0A5M6IB88_9PROT|nr:PA0069 family radical SAM protein [Roseospira marina]KAA5605564.1 PA0069 family radical SAM protein [Roseospira marina]MBB4313373.1 DNA repair photolyase [Roseospira marina]MBB5085886.1 DNA repair photolyase [Roseospira marina]
MTRSSHAPPPRSHRGALSNPDGRFEPVRHEAEDDGWGTLEPIASDDADRDGWGPPPSPATRVEVDTSRSILARNDSPDIPFDRSINLYRGCEHGCVYCYARPTHAYLGLSPGLDFETRLFMKPDAAALLDATLRKPGYRPAPIAIGTNTDPYQPVERRFGLMRQVLEVLSAFHHPVTITTKSAMVERDTDILADLAARRLAAVGLSITTLDRDVARRLEPRASPPEARLRAIRTLRAAGVPVSVMAAPMIPGLNDHELERILDAAADAGAVQADYILVRLPREVEGLVREWLEAHVPDRARRVMSRIAAMRDGAASSARFHDRMRGSGPEAALLGQRFTVAATRLGLTRRGYALDTRQFAPPPRPGDQLALF